MTRLDPPHTCPILVFVRGTGGGYTPKGYATVADALADHHAGPFILTQRIDIASVIKEPTDTRAQAVKRGLLGGAARAASLTPKRRKQIARKAAKARWGK